MLCQHLRSITSCTYHMIRGDGKETVLQFINKVDEALSPGLKDRQMGRRTDRQTDRQNQLPITTLYALCSIHVLFLHRICTCSM